MAAAWPYDKGHWSQQGPECWLSEAWLKNWAGEPRKQPTCLIVGCPSQVLSALATTGLWAVLEDPRAGQGLRIPAGDHGAFSEQAQPRKTPKYEP